MRSLRLEAFTRAAVANVDLVFTFWYSKISQSAVERYREIIERSGGTVDLVHLHCRPDVLEQRVTGDSRRGKKIDNVTDLRVALLEYGTANMIAGTTLTIENSDLEPTDVAKRISKFFGLTISL